MTTSVYLSNEEVIVIRGTAYSRTLKIRRFQSVPMPKGAIINGMITDEEAIKAILAQLRRRGALSARNVRLVIDSSLVMVKVENVPVLPRRRLMEFTKNTFAEMVETHGELLCDYSVIDAENWNGRGCAILCSAMEKSMAEMYIRLFREAGVELGSIDISLNSLIKLLKYSHELSRRTFILSVLDASYMSSFLFINGQYIFVRSNRLLCERESHDSFAEISSVISSILQFNKAQKSEYDITSVYFCGLSDRETGLCHEISSSLNIDSLPFLPCHAIGVKNKILKSGFKPSNYLFAIGNLIKK